MLTLLPGEAAVQGGDGQGGGRVGDPPSCVASEKGSPHPVIHYVALTF